MRNGKWCSQVLWKRVRENQSLERIDFIQFHILFPFSSIPLWMCWSLLFFPVDILHLHNWWLSGFANCEKFFFFSFNILVAGTTAIVCCVQQLARTIFNLHGVIRCQCCCRTAFEEAFLLLSRAYLIGSTTCRCIINEFRYRSLALTINFNAYK